MSEAMYYSISEVSILLKVAYLTVYRWIRAGKLDAYKIQKQYRIEDKDLKKFITKYGTN